jgi:hypothetical protein
MLADDDEDAVEVIFPLDTVSADEGVAVPIPTLPDESITPPGIVVAPERVTPLSVLPDGNVVVPVSVVLLSVLPDVSAAQLKFAMTWLASVEVPFVIVYGYDVHSAIALVLSSKSPNRPTTIALYMFVL